MVTTIKKFGDEYALVLNREMMDQLNIRPDTPLQITPNCTSFSVGPVEDAEDEALFVKALEETHQEYGRVLKKLAE